MAEVKLHKLSRVTMKPDKKPKAELDEMDSVKRSMSQNNDDRSRAIEVLMQAQSYWDAGARFRRDRERNKRYNFGDQWGDMVCVDGKMMTEEQYIRQQGNISLKNNLIHRLVRNVIGVFRSQNSEPTCAARDRDEQPLAETMSTVLQYNMQLNGTKELYARTMEEFLISGLAVHKKWFGWRRNKLDCWTDYVKPDNFFVDNNMKDFRGWDCTMIGEIHDIGFEDLCEQFAKSRDDYQRLSNIYSSAKDHNRMRQTWGEFGYKINSGGDSFLFPRSHSLCRVIEVWRKESKPRYRCHDYNNGDVFKIDVGDLQEMVTSENINRLAQAASVGMPEEEVPLIKAEWFMDSYWYYYFLSPCGDILMEGETPYAHGEHPYVMKAYPFIDGEIHSFVSDVIDQQRYTNRLITLYDWIMRASVKGVLMIPEGAIPDNMTPEDFAETCTKFNGVVVYKAKPGVPLPQQVSNNSTNIGINELLQLQIKFFEDISGVNGALQGKQGYAGTSAALYNQQTQNATTSLLDILETFQEFIKESAYKDVKNIQQYYDEERYKRIAGKNGYVEVEVRNIHNVEFDLSMVPSTATPAYRAMANDFLMQIWDKGQISLEQLLEHGDFPFADQLLQSIKTQKQQMEQGQMPEGASPQLQGEMQAAQQRANMTAVNQLYGAIKGNNMMAAA